MNNKKKTNSKSLNTSIKIIIGLGLVIALVSTVFLVKNNASNQKASTNGTNTKKEAQFSENGDMIIPVADVTDKANFYAYDVDGTKMEVIAIKASDGSIRTAFNTCQVCYSSGKGYYVQEGDKLVCQNCGNKFAASDVEVVKGGCNPVPITTDYKTVDEKNITISKDYLDSAKVIFENWKNN